MDILFDRLDHLVGSPDALRNCLTVDASARELQDGDPIRIFNDLGDFVAKVHVTDKMLEGTIWMRDGWVGLNNVTSGSDVLPDAALNLFPFTVGQTNFGAQVDVAGVSE